MGGVYFVLRTASGEEKSDKSMRQNLRKNILDRHREARHDVAAIQDIGFGQRDDRGRNSADAQAFKR